MIREAIEQSGIPALLGWREAQDDEDSIISRAWAAALYPFQLAVSPTALKLYLTVFLFLSTSFILLSISTAAFGVFYYNYIPQTDFERPIYLQYASDKYPYAEIPLPADALISQQPYDVSIVLHMPRDPTNLRAGNFMLDLSIHGSTDKLAATVLETLKLEDQVPNSAIYRSRRPALMPYASTTTDLVSKLIHLPFHVLSWHDFDSVTLTIPMFEQVEFARGRDNIPKSATLQLQTQRPPTGEQEGLHVYNARLIFQVRFHGLRYLIYNYRSLAFIVFSALFYGTSITTLALGWAVMATVFRSKDESAVVKADNKTRVKLDSGTDEASQTATTDNRPIKKEPADDTEGEKEAMRGRPTEMTPQTSNPASAASQEPSVPVDESGGVPEEHADDEEEESEDEWEQMERIRRKMDQDARQRQLARQQHDSGIGTSLESENAAAARAGLIRRSSSSRKDIQ